jgi:hypothetical protein
MVFVWVRAGVFEHIAFTRPFVDGIANPYRIRLYNFAATIH